PVAKLTHSKFVQRAKPFCETPENEIALYAYLKKIEFQTVRCPYAPSALRTDIREFLNNLEVKHPGAKFTIYRSFEKLRPLLKSTVEVNLNECKFCGEPTVSEICESCLMLEKLGIQT
ncbi:MAG: TIGR00269 family protein, partial [Candidatus Bathyarchaeota archaeon]